MARPRKPPRMEQRENGTWEVVFFDPKAQRTRHLSLGTDREDIARTEFSRWLIKYSPEDVAKETLTVGDVLTFYEEYAKRELLGWKTVESTIKKLRDHFGPLPARAVNAKTVKEYTTKRLATVKGATIRNELTVLSSAYSYAAKEGFGDLDYMPIFKKPPISNPKVDFLSAAQMETLLTHLEATRINNVITDEEAFVVIAFRAAARRTAILELTWDRVRWDSKLIDFQTPKWKALPRARQSKRRAVVPMSDKLYAFMQELRAQRGGTKIFTVSDHTIARRLAEIGKELGFSITPHLLRRTFGSIASMMGKPMLDISRVMGNSQKVCEERYAHFHPDYLKGAVDLDEYGVSHHGEKR
jgi:integrase